MNTFVKKIGGAAVTSVVTAVVSNATIRIMNNVMSPKNNSKQDEVDIALRRAKFLKKERVLTQELINKC